MSYKKLNRSFIGIEIDERYYKIAEDRILNENENENEQYEKHLIRDKEAIEKLGVSRSSFYRILKEWRENELWKK